MGMRMEDHNSIAALVLDFGGVIQRTFDPRPRRCLEHQLGLPEGGAEQAVFGSPQWRELELGRTDVDAFWLDLAGRLDLDADGISEFKRLFWGGDRLDEELLDLIRELRAMGLYTILLSNGPPDREQSLREMGIADAFDSVVVSGQEGVMKPGLEIYERALARAGIAPERAVFIDDFVDNVAAACRLGMVGVRFKGLAPLRPQLANLGIAVPAVVREPVVGVRAVVFDWAGVMERSPDETYMADWEARLALQPGQLPGLLWGPEWRQVELGLMQTSEYCQWLGARLGLADGEAAHCFIEEFYDGDWLNENVVAAARALHARYKLALVSNAYPEQDTWLKEKFGVDVAADFDVYVNSARTGLRKPDPAILELALQRLDVRPEEAVFLDDALRNVDAARALGMHTVHFIDPIVSLGDLEALLGHPILA